MLRFDAVPEPVATLLGLLATNEALEPFDDVAELLKHQTLIEMLGFFSRKYTNTDPFAVIRSLVWFEEAEQEPDPIPLAGQKWVKVKQVVTDAVARL